MSNFNFLKRVNENLFIIAYEAEKLFRDEYFEQCITQTRRLAENLCRDVVGERSQSCESFDNMLELLKDTPAQNDFEKEFIEDLYFLKKAGNESVHSIHVKQDGNLALECMHRAFEAALNYAVFKKGLDSKYLQQQFDDELLATGRKKAKSSLAEKYDEEKKNTAKKRKNTKKYKRKNKNLDYEEENTNDSEPINKSTPKEGKKPLWREVAETIAAGLIIAVVYFLIFNK